MSMVILIVACKYTVVVLCPSDSDYRINAHSIHNKLDMKSQLDDFTNQFEMPWTEYAERVLPRKLRHVLKYHSNAFPVGPTSVDDLSSAQIPSNSEGVPLFPTIDLDQVVPSEIRNILEKYFKTLWGK
jgi:hypothetical protein